MTTPARPYLRTPALTPDGARLAFVYAGDIWVVPTTGGDAVRITALPSSNSNPRWSPDGLSIAYSASRSGSTDAYVLNLGNGEPRRLTFHEVPTLVECWSPDGSALYVSSAAAQQGNAIYRVAIQGGTPVLWAAQPYETLSDVAIAPDQSNMALAIIRDVWWRRGPNPYGGAQIWVRANQPESTETFLCGATPGMNRWPLWDRDGSGLYFVSDRDGTANIWFCQRDGSAAEQLTHFQDGRVLWPSLSTESNLLVFERNCQIWRLDLLTGTTAPIDIRALPGQEALQPRVYTVSRDMQELALSPDGKKLAFTTRGEVYADFADKETDKELRQGPAFQVTATAARERDLSWSSDSKRLLYVSDRHGDPEVYTYDFASASEGRLTESQHPKAAPQTSPDGAWVAYGCGDNQIRLINTRTGADQAFVQAQFSFAPSFCWSPDSAWLAFIAHDQHYFENLYVQRLGETQAHQISFLSNLTSSDPLWAPNGQFIVFTTRQYRAEAQIARVDLRHHNPVFRESEFEKLFDAKDSKETKEPKDSKESAKEAANTTKVALSAQPEQPQPASQPAESLISHTDEDRGTEPMPEPAPPEPVPASAEKAAPKPARVEIVFDGIDRRLRLLTPPQLDAHAQALSPDSKDLIMQATVMGKPNLWVLAMDEPRADQPARQLTATTGHKSAVQFAPDGKSFYYLDGSQIAFRKFPTGETSYPAYSAEVRYDFQQEKWQIFNECWRRIRDEYYDPTFGGNDWQALRDQYAPLVAGAQTHSELVLLIRLLTGELGTSHHSFTYAGTSTEVSGYLGITIDAGHQAATGELRIATLLADGPAALAGVQAGETLLAIDGRAPGRTSLDELLLHMIGRRIRLRLRDASGAEREVLVRPVGREQYSDLQYRAWVHTNEAIVSRASNGRLGYVHIPEMSYEAYQQFLVDLDAEVYGKQGLVLDLRHNHGGHTATFFLDILTRQSSVLKAARGRTPGDAWHLAGNRVLNRPTVLVVNEESASNAEIFTEAYRQHKIGPIVGRPTAGGVISTYQTPMIDGMRLGLPIMRVTTLDGEDMEGRGRPVDYDVRLPLDTPPDRDPQLETAARVLLERLGDPQ